ncbi:hypothetical protein ACE1CD_24690 [Aerosakkonema sp. BLCC-F183]|uniref:hypothetical protein n=1 Tax=Aerosakkonema sp. BLCC-F183 TaxID=3342834 RepID=UPI0035BAB5CD
MKPFEEMEPIQNILPRILAQITEQHPTIQTVINQLKQTDTDVINSLRETFPPEVQQFVSNSPLKIRVLDCNMAVYLPLVDIEQIKKFIVDMARLCGGASCFPILGLWESPAMELIGEDILLVRFFMTRQALNEHAETVLKSVYHLGQILNQTEMAMEIGIAMWRGMLLIPTK